MNYLIILMCVLTSCTIPSASKSLNSESGGLPVIDVTKEYPRKDLFAQDIADIEYIPLETNDSTLTDHVRPDAISDQHIVYHNQNGQILVFDRQGKILYSFNRTGGGPEEYNMISEVVLDEKRKELYVSNVDLETRIYVYSLNGTFKRKLALPSKYYPRCLMNSDKDYLFCYNSYCVDMPNDILKEDDIRKRDNPYFFISKQTGKILPLIYNIPNRIVNVSYDLSGAQANQYINIFPLVRNASNILISEFADDTVYSLKKEKLFPIMIKKPSAHQMNPPVLVGADLITDKYIFFNTIEKDPDKRDVKQTSMAYDKESGAFYQLNLKNKDDSLKRIINMYGNELLQNAAISCMGAEFLLCGIIEPVT